MRVNTSEHVQKEVEGLKRPIASRHQHIEPEQSRVYSEGGSPQETINPVLYFVLIQTPHTRPIVQSRTAYK